MECVPTVNFMYQWLVLEKDYIHVLTVEKWLNNTSMAQLNMYLWAMARIKFKEIVIRDKPKKRPGRHKKRRNKHEKRQLAKYKKLEEQSQKRKKQNVLMDMQKHVRRR